MKDHFNWGGGAHAPCAPVFPLPLMMIDYYQLGDLDSPIHLLVDSISASSTSKYSSAITQHLDWLIKLMIERLCYWRTILLSSVPAYT